MKQSEVGRDFVHHCSIEEYRRGGVVGDWGFGVVVVVIFVQVKSEGVREGKRVRGFCRGIWLHRWPTITLFYVTAADEAVAIVVVVFCIRLGCQSNFRLGRESNIIRL